jgi:hypothetical protein
MVEDVGDIIGILGRDRARDSLVIVSRPAGSINDGHLHLKKVLVIPPHHTSQRMISKGT